MSATDLLQLLLLLVAAFGLFLNLSQMKVNAKQKVAEYINELFNQYYADGDITDIYYKIEYGKFHYDAESFHQSDEERKLDKLLKLYNNIGKLYSLSNLTTQDLDYVVYGYLVVYQDKSVKEYLTFLDEWYVLRGLSVRPFYPFRTLGAILEKQYYDSQ